MDTTETGRDDLPVVQNRTLAGTESRRQRENGKKGGRPKKEKNAMRLTSAQFDTLFGVRGLGRPCRCVGGNPCHTALWKKGLIRIRFISRREYTIEVTPAGSTAVDEHLSRRTKSTLHE